MPGGAVRRVPCPCPCCWPVLLARAADRDRQPGQVSDATAAIVAGEHGRWQLLDEVPAGYRIAIRTEQPLAASLAGLGSLFGVAGRVRHRGTGTAR